MIPLSEVRVLDANAEALGIPTASLVENAGRALAEHLRPIAGQGPVVFLVGPGNNGADGLVAARILASERIAVEILLPFHGEGWKSAEAKRTFLALPPQVKASFEPTLPEVEAALARGSVIVDALLGAGVSGALREPYASWCGLLAKARSRVVAVDVPTAFSYVPRETLTFHDIKEGMSEQTAGRIRVVDVGIPRDAALYTGPGEYLLYPQGKQDQHKGEGGIVLVIGGGPYTGAPAVAGLAALRAGADLAIILTPQRAWSVIAGYSPNLVVRPLNGDDLNFDDPANRVTLATWMKKAHSVVLGPGLGLMASTQKSVHHVLERAQREGVPCVVDADALTALAQRRDLLGPRIVVTPHAAEFRSITGVELPRDPLARGAAAQKAAKDHGATWLVKGPIDAVADADRLKLNAAGHPAMSVGGTGDALAGIVGALLAKKLSPFDAARLGARLAGDAGQLAAKHKSWGLLATDVVDALPTVLAERVARSS